MDMAEQFNQFDWIVVGIILVSALFGAGRGFARESTSFLGWIGAFVLANILALPLSETLIDLIDDRSFRYLASWGLIFLAVVFLFGRVGRWLSSQLRQPGLNFGNRLLGAGFGVARGMVIAAIVTLGFKVLLPDSEDGQEITKVLYEWCRRIQEKALANPTAERPLDVRTCFAWRLVSASHFCILRVCFVVCVS